VGVHGARAKSPNMPVVHRESTRPGQRIRSPLASTTSKWPASTTERRAISVPGQDFASPGDGVHNANAVRLTTHPQLEVLGAIVVTPTVAVMDLLSREEQPTEHLLHHEDVLEDIPVVTRAARMARRFRIDIATRTVLARFAAAPPTRTLGAPGPLRLALDAGPRAATHQLAAPGTRRAPGLVTTPRTDAVPAGRLELAVAGGAVLHCRQCPQQASRRASRQPSRERHVTVQPQKFRAGRGGGAPASRARVLWARCGSG
jgi:hypothetical protein